MNIVVTGASKGIGYAIAEAFAAAGNQVLLCARNVSVLTEAAATLQQQHPGAKLFHCAADLSDKAGVEGLAKCVKDNFGTTDVLVNNAGRFVPGSIHSEPEGILEELLQTNLFSAYHLTRLLLPGMLAAGSGHIFNICSIAALQPYPNGGSYSISKFALHGFSQNLREELKPHGIKVTSVHPGAVYTASWAFSDVDPARIMTSSDVAAMVFAASRLSPQANVEEIVLRPQLGDL
jgi:short-subunit dehydrogenase